MGVAYCFCGISRQHELGRLLVVLLPCYLSYPNQAIERVSETVKYKSLQSAQESQTVCNTFGHGKTMTCLAMVDVALGKGF